MITLMPGEETEVPTDKMAMRSIANAEHCQISEINIKVTGYAIGDDERMNPNEVCGACKYLENFE